MAGKRKEITWEVNKNGCHICTSHAYNTYGYPQCKINYKIKLLHRLAYEQKHGEIPPRMMVCHKCDNPHCINPDHLFLGTSQDNVDDMVKKGRQSHHGSPGLPGEKHPQCKLTENQVLEIRAYQGVTDKAIAQIYGISTVNINNIRNRKIWTHI
jgi:hypothetical protein